MITTTNPSHWIYHNEASLNWLALGLLLAAWNAADRGDDLGTPRRPEALRGYLAVSVRAVHRPGGPFDATSRPASVGIEGDRR